MDSKLREFEEQQASISQLHEAKLKKHEILKIEHNEKKLKEDEERKLEAA